MFCFLIAIKILILLKIYYNRKRDFCNTLSADFTELFGRTAEPGLADGVIIPDIRQSF